MASIEKRNRAKSIVLLCQHFYPEMVSTGMHMTELGIALTKLGWQIEVVCAQPSLILERANDRVPWEMDYQGITIHRVRTVGSHKGTFSRILMAVSFCIGAFFRLFLTGNRYTGIVLGTNPPFAGIIGVLLKRIIRMPYVMIVYDVYPDLAIELGALNRDRFLARAWNWFTVLSLRNSEAVVVIGRDMASIVARKIGVRPDSPRLPLIPNWSDAASVCPVPKDANTFRKRHVPEGIFLVQYSGRMARTHNLEPLIEAADLLKDEPVFFQFIGDGAKRCQLMEIVQRKALKNVQFLPYQPLSLLGEVLSAADLAVVCLGKEFTGLSVPSKTYGILASGTPVLAFMDQAGEISLTICENECGVCIPEPTGPSVAEAIRELRADPEQCRRLSNNGRRAFLQKYTLEKAAASYHSILATCFGVDSSTNVEQTQTLCGMERTPI